MSSWWKSPVLQGEDNDYGQYDYLIEEIPKDYAKWEISKYKWNCHSCQRKSHLLFRSEHFFYTLDGWDSMDYAECWMCRLKGKFHGIKQKLKKRIKTFKLAIKIHKEISEKDFKFCYKLAKKIERC